MYETFKYAEKFNQPLAWDFSRVTSTQNMFEYAYEFNPEGLPYWNTGSVTSMSTMFTYSPFDQPFRFNLTGLEREGCVWPNYAFDGLSNCNKAYVYHHHP